VIGTAVVFHRKHYHNTGCYNLQLKVYYDKSGDLIYRDQYSLRRLKTKGRTLAAFSLAIDGKITLIICSNDDRSTGKNIIEIFCASEVMT
jgi:hypothetical protein